MKIGIISPSIYMSQTRYPDMIFAPRDLVINLADGLVESGNEVYFFTAGDVKSKAQVVSGDMDLIEKNFVEGKLEHEKGERFKWASFYAVKRNYELDLSLKAYQMAKEGKLDIIHSYHDTLAHFYNELTGFPTVYTLHDPIITDKTHLMYWYLNRFKHHNYISISNAYRRCDGVGINFIDTVYHGLDLDLYHSANEPVEYLSFMGRMAPEKGVDVAIEIAKKSRIPIKIATSDMEENKDLPYYKEKVEPLLTDSQVEFVGYMNDEKKSEFLGRSKAFLFPIDWEEPFGMVMIEAMASGTPVIAYNRGSVQEIVKDGVTGFIIDENNENRKGKGGWVIKKTGIEGLVEAVNRINEIDRADCRKHVEKNFTITKMVEGYERVYNKILSQK